MGALGDRDYVVSGRGGADAGLVAAGRGARAVRDVYSEEMARMIASEYARARDTLRTIHESDEMHIPPPEVIRRWRRENPDFDMLMKDCEAVRAETFMEETIDISDDNETTPDRAKVRIAARQRLAAGYDRGRFGVGAGAADGDDPNRVKSVRQMTRAQLEAAARAAGLLKNGDGAGAEIDGATGLVTQ